jgi:ketosteroid isomerase-like protein
MLIASEHSSWISWRAIRECNRNFSRFLDRINKRDADTLAELMTEDHVFIDSLGNTIKAAKRYAWVGEAIIHFARTIGLPMWRFWEMEIS